MGPGEGAPRPLTRARRGLQGWMGDKGSRDLSTKETYTEARFLRNSHKRQISIASMGGAILFQLERGCCCHRNLLPYQILFLVHIPSLSCCLVIAFSSPLMWTMVVDLSCSVAFSSQLDILLTKLIQFVPNPWFYGLYNFKALSLIFTKSQENFQWAPSLMSMGNPISPSFCEFSQLYQRPWYSGVNFHGELLITHHSHVLLWD